ncbi:MAG: hypothetical protein M3Y08_19390 [Fibrobacterota bacterium]|nr:hypothetical protein [Fibrobacterota bacterium]
MLLRSLLFSSTLGLMALGNAWSGSPLVALVGQNTMMEESQPVIATETAGEPESEAPFASKAPSAHVTALAPKATSANRLISPSPAMGEHAPLALFSLGSLAVGGVFYAIHLSSRSPNVAYTAGDRTQLTSAVGAAGLTALLAAGSYFYFARQSSLEARKWDAQVSGGVDPEGDLNVGALITLPLPSLSR